MGFIDSKIGNSAEEVNLLFGKSGEWSQRVVFLLVDEHLT